MRIDRLIVEQFRGIASSELAFQGGSIILGGGNGTGKTAFVDALEFLYTGAIGPLTGTAGLSVKDHALHIGGSLKDASVCGHFDRGAETARRTLTGTLTASESVREYFQKATSTAFILRRSQLQDFIHAKPAERYRSLADLIGADALDRVEVAMKRARDSIEQTVLRLEVQRTDHERRMQELPDEDADADLLFEANEGFESLGFPEYHLNDVADAPQIRTAVLARLTPPKPNREDEARSRLLAELEQGMSGSALRDALSHFGALVPQGGPQMRQAQALDLLQLLRRGRDYLRETEESRCPVCQREVDARALLGNLVGRMADLEEVSLRQERLDRARDDLDAALQDTSGRLKTISGLQRQGDSQGSRDKNPANEILADAIAMLRESLRADVARQTIEIASRVEDALERWNRWSSDTRELLGRPTSPEPLEDSRPDVEAVLALLQEIGIRHAQSERGRQERSRLQTEIERVEKELVRQQSMLRIADVSYQTFHAVKMDELQRIYDDLQSDLVRLYDLVHPGEEHGLVAIELDPRKRGSSELRMDFFGQRQQDPRAYASEGHLDTLGLCIFLAFAKRFHAEWPLLVLDDVVSSVDAAHKRRVAAMLFREFGDRQLFVTTHDARWFNELRTAGRDAGRSNTQSLVIDAWQLQAGTRVRPAPALP